MGRIKRLLRQDLTPRAEVDLICPICKRRIPKAQIDAHHLIPKSKGGKKTEFLHRICHRQIHALFTEGELAKHLNSIEALTTHPDMDRFIAWIRNKPENFTERIKISNLLRAKKTISRNRSLF